ncbi:hypothetical protein Hsc_0198 [Herbaspirillum seropedicae]|nr:hypothetical protein Hsc_0198 [Herbaspirillum seropedicae]
MVLKFPGSSYKLFASMRARRWPRIPFAIAFPCDPIALAGGCICKFSKARFCGAKT